jgi:hypothetical protein
VDVTLRGIPHNRAQDIPESEDNGGKPIKPNVHLPKFTQLATAMEVIQGRTRHADSDVDIHVLHVWSSHCEEDEHA